METLMRILLVEDHTQLAGLVSRELTAEYGYEVVCARDPLEARELYESASFDLAIVDLLFEHLNRAFERRPVPGTLTNGRMLTSGLTTVSELSRAPHRTGIVLYTAAEADRRLHMLYAYEDLGIRVFCSKAPGTGRVDNVADALSAAAAAERRRSLTHQWGRCRARLDHPSNLDGGLNVQRSRSLEADREKT